MEFIGIDFGNYKTIIASSKENGKIITDEQGKRSIKTMLELSTPIRKFGNSITGEVEQVMQYRFRKFRDDILDKDGSKNVMMFLKYLDRNIKASTAGSPSICISIPSYFSEKQRRMLLELVKCCGMKVDKFFNDISSVGMFACLRREKVPASFMVIDFGYSKTQIGLFSYENNVFKPLYVNHVKIGGSNFDEKLLGIIFKKYSIDDTKLAREKILRNIDKLKTVLNSTSSASTQVYITESALNIQVTQEEYEIALKDELEKLNDFIDRVFAEIDFKGVVEVTGGNSSSFLIKNLIDKKFEYQVTCNSSDSCAIGTALGHACSILSNKIVINDILAREISVKLGDSDETKKSLVFKSSDLVGTSKVVTYNRKGGFKVDVTENDDVIGVLEITKEETDEPEPVKITFEITKYGTINVPKVHCGGDVSFTYKTFELSEEEKKELLENERFYRDLEDSIEKIGNMRNELETMAMKLGDALEEKFGGIVTEEEISCIKELALEIFDIQPSKTVEEEEGVKKSILEKLSFVSKKLEEYGQEVINNLKQCKSIIVKFNEENPRVFTPSFYKLQGMLYNIDDKINKFSLNVYNISEYVSPYTNKIRDDIEGYISKAVVEIQEKKEKDRRLEEEKRKLEEEAKKKKESEETEKENDEAKHSDEKKEDDGEIDEEKDI